MKTLKDLRKDNITKEWLDAFDNVVFRVYSTDGKVDVALLENDKIYEYYCDNAEALSKKYPKVKCISKCTDVDVDVELCKKVEGVWYSLISLRSLSCSSNFSIP